MEFYESKYTVNESPVYVSDNMTGKMAGVPAISTSVLCNPICVARRANGDSICAHCFAVSTMKRYSKANEHAEKNAALLMNRILAKELLPIFGNVRFVRIEAFGDVCNVTQAVNYAHIAKVNPGVIFGWWSKNVSIIARAFDQIGGKPENIILIESSEKVNVEKEPSSPYVDKVFTVYDKKFIKENGVEINCGARSCVSCQRCYTKGTEAKVHEILK